MATPAKDIVQRVVGMLQDPTSIHWPIDELARHFNDAQREIAVLRPDAVIVNGPVALVPGTHQTLPAGATKLRAITHNSAGSRRAITQVPQSLLDAQLPGWHARPAALEIQHYMYDPLDPCAFLVYPPAASGASVQAAYPAMPAGIPIPAAGGTWSDVTGELAVPDLYANAVQDYMLYRAYSKDAEHAGNAALAQAHRVLFTTALGSEVQATASVAPQAA